MKKRSSKEEKLGDVLQKFINSSNLSRPFLNYQVQIQFEEIMGPFLMKKVKKIFVKDNKLYLKLDSAPFKQEISIQKTKLINDLNRAIDKNYLIDIVFIGTIRICYEVFIDSALVFINMLLRVVH